MNYKDILTNNANFAKKLLLLGGICIILLCSVGKSLAYIKSIPNQLENTFEKTDVRCAVSDTLNGNEKTNIKVKNTSPDVPVYIRCAVTVTWQTSDGKKIYGKTPILGTDYYLPAPANVNGWTLESDGYYYYANIVAPGKSTLPLFTESVKQIANNPAQGYTLCVEIAAEAIQTDDLQGAIVQEAWGRIP